MSEQPPQHDRKPPERVAPLGDDWWAFDNALKLGRALKREKG